MPVRLTPICFGFSFHCDDIIITAQSYDIDRIHSIIFDYEKIINYNNTKYCQIILNSQYCSVDIVGIAILYVKIIIIIFRYSRVQYFIVYWSLN